jgi:hypothetical protein
MLLHIAEKRPEFDWGWRWLGFDAARSMKSPSLHLNLVIPYPQMFPFCL